MLHLTAMMKAFLSIIIKGYVCNTYQTLRFLIQCFVWVQNVYVIYTNFAYNYFIPKKLTVCFLILFSAF